MTNPFTAVQQRGESNLSRHPLVTEDLDRMLTYPLPWTEFSEKTAVVSGASGLLGGWMVETFLRLNEIGRLPSPMRIIAVSRSKERLERRFGHHLGRNDLIFHTADIAQGLHIDGPADIVIHAGTPASPKEFATDLLGAFDAHVSGTRAMLDLARAKKADRFLLMSSGAVYGHLPKGVESIREDLFGGLDPLNPRAAYEEGKRAAETLCSIFVSEYGLPVRIARISHTYGPGMRRGDGRAFADIIAAVAERRPVELHSDGSAIRYYCYAADTVLGMFFMLIRGQNGAAYNVGSATERISVADLAELAAGLFSERGVTVRYRTRNEGGLAMASLQPPIPLDVSRLHALGWKAEIGIREGFRRTILSYDMP